MKGSDVRPSGVLVFFSLLFLSACAVYAQPEEVPEFSLRVAHSGLVIYEPALNGLSPEETEEKLPHQPLRGDDVTISMWRIYDFGASVLDGQTAGLGEIKFTLIYPPQSETQVKLQFRLKISNADGSFFADAFAMTGRIEDFEKGVPRAFVEAVQAYREPFKKLYLPTAYLPHVKFMIENSDEVLESLAFFFGKYIAVDIDSLERFRSLIEGKTFDEIPEQTGMALRLEAEARAPVSAGSGSETTVRVGVNKAAGYPFEVSSLPPMDILFGEPVSKTEVMFAKAAAEHGSVGGLPYSVKTSVIPVRMQREEEVSELANLVRIVSFGKRADNDFIIDCRTYMQYGTTPLINYKKVLYTKSLLEAMTEFDHLCGPGTHEALRRQLDEFLFQVDETSSKGAVFTAYRLGHNALLDETLNRDWREIFALDKARIEAIEEGFLAAEEQEKKRREGLAEKAFRTAGQNGENGTEISGNASRGEQGGDDA